VIRDVTLGQGFEDVFAQYGAILSRVANSYEANEAMQQELLQEIAIAVWQGLSRFKGDSSVKTYILKIAHNRAVTHVANQVKRLDTHQYDHYDLGSDVFASTTHSPEEMSSQHQSLERLLRAVRALPLQSRQVLTLSLEGLSYDEIADVCGLTKNHVGVILSAPSKVSCRSNRMHNSDKENQTNPPVSVDDGQNDGLSALWQAQPVTTINLSEVKASLSSERTKQRWYMLLDSLMVIPAIYILNKYWGHMSFVAQMMFLFMLVTSLPLLIYQLWLRRVAAFYKDSQTTNYLTQLTKQIKNNVKIAFITKHSTWVAVVFGIAFILERYLFGDHTPEKITKMSIVMAVMTTGMSIWYVWADKRQKRFERQLETLEKMAQQR